jgi:IS30 family transposase
MAHRELNLRERRAIEDMLNAKMSVDKIAAEVGWHRSTVYREIKRNRFVDDELPNLNGYYGMNAHRLISIDKHGAAHVILGDPSVESTHQLRQVSDLSAQP